MLSERIFWVLKGTSISPTALMITTEAVMLIVLLFMLNGFYSYKGG